MARSLSVLLPVKNAQSTLTPTVHKILDAVAEISDQIELLIIDDGSADATSEVATELTRHYPQVRAICQGRSLGTEAAIRSGLQKSRGEIALIHEQASGKPLGEVIKTLKSSDYKGQYYFRLDTAGSSPEYKPAEHPLPLVNFQAAEHPHEQNPRISSRPGRPNFLGRIKDFVLGE